MNILTSSEKVVSYGDVVWNDALNFSREGTTDILESEAQAAELTRMLVGGWDKAHHGLLRVVELTDAEAAEAVELRKAELDRLEQLLKSDNRPGGQKHDLSAYHAGKAVYDVSFVDFYNALVELWKSKGKYVKPKYSAVWAFRRSKVMPWAHALALKAGLPGIDQLPAEIVQYESEDDRRLDCLLENQRRNQGVVRPSMANNLRAAWRWASDNAKANGGVADWKVLTPRFREAFSTVNPEKGTVSPTQYQKVQEIVKLALRFNGKELDGKPVDFIANCVDGTYNVRAVPNGTELKAKYDSRASLEEVDKYLKNPKGSKPKRSASRKAVQEFADGLNTPSTVGILECVINDKLPMIAEAEKLTEESLPAFLEKVRS